MVGRINVAQLTTIGVGALAGQGLNFAGKYIDDAVYETVPTEVYKRWPSMVASFGGGLLLFALPSFMKQIKGNMALGMQVAGGSAIAAKAFEIIKAMTENGGEAARRAAARRVATPIMNNRRTMAPLRAMPLTNGAMNGNGGMRDFAVIGRS